MRSSARPQHLLTLLRPLTTATKPHNGLLQTMCLISNTAFSHDPVPTARKRGRQEAGAAVQ